MLMRNGVVVTTLAIMLAVFAANGAEVISCSSEEVELDTVTVKQAPLTLPIRDSSLRLDYSASMWNESGDDAATAKITVNGTEIMNEPGEGSTVWQTTEAGLYFVRHVANGITLAKTIAVVESTVEIEKVGDNICKLTATGGGDLEIRYTLDGSAPTVDSPLYTGPFEVPEDRLSAVRAVTFASDGSLQGVVAVTAFDSTEDHFLYSQALCEIDNSPDVKTVGWAEMEGLSYDIDWGGEDCVRCEFYVNGNSKATDMKDKTGKDGKNIDFYSSPAGDFVWDKPRRGGTNTLTLAMLNANGETKESYSAQYYVIPREQILTDVDLPLENFYNADLRQWVTNITITSRNVMNGFSQKGANKLFKDVRAVFVVDGIDYIPANTFAGCANLKKVVFRGNAPDCGDSAFQGVPRDAKAVVYPWKAGWPDITNTWQRLKIEYASSFLPSNVVDVAAILENTSGSLKINITDQDEYASFREWLASAVGDKDLTNGVTRAALRDSQSTWLAFMLDRPLLIGQTFEGEDVEIVAIAPSCVEGAFEVGVGLNGVEIGEDIDRGRLEKTFRIAGAPELDEEKFSTENVTLQSIEAEGGKVKITVKPSDTASGYERAFFFRLNVNP